MHRLGGERLEYPHGFLSYKSTYGAPRNQWLFLVPQKGGIGSIWGPPEGKDCKWYISGICCQLGDGLCHRSHLLGEPETTIDGQLSNVQGPLPGKSANVTFLGWITVRLG